MGVRAVIKVVDDQDDPTWFIKHWASKPYQVQHVAGLIHWIDEKPGVRTMDTAGYLAYATVGRGDGLLPTEDVSDSAECRDPNEPIDLDHRYELTLSEVDRSFRYVVFDRTRAGEEEGPFRVAEDLADRVALYGAAARMAKGMASSTRAYAAHNGGYTPPSMPPAESWDAEAEKFMGWMADVDGKPAVAAVAEEQPNDDSPIKVGDLVISWDFEGTFKWGGPGDDPRFPQIEFSYGEKVHTVRCVPEKVAPHDIAIPARDERVVVQKLPEKPYGAAGPWLLTVFDSRECFKTKRDATAAGLRRVAIRDWHETRVLEAAPAPAAEQEPASEPAGVKKPATSAVDSRPFVLWGKHPGYADGVPIKLTAGTTTHCRAEMRYRQGLGGWSGLTILPQGAAYVEPATMTDPATGVEVAVTRLSIASQIEEAARQLGMTAVPSTTPSGAAAFTIDGRTMTPGEWADHLLEGGYEGAYGRNQVIINPERLTEVAAAEEPAPATEQSAPSARTIEILRVATWSLDVVTIKGQKTGMDVLKLNSGYLNYQEEFKPVAEVVNSLGGVWNKQARGFTFKPSEPQFGGSYTTPGRDKLNDWLERHAPASAETTPATTEAPVTEIDNRNEEKPMTNIEQGNNVDPRIAGWVNEIMEMIEEDITNGIVPAGARSFGELHSYLDANDYTETAQVPWGLSVASEGDPDGMGLLSGVQTEVTRRLVERVKAEGRKADAADRPVTYTDDGRGFIVSGNESWYVTQCCGSPVTFSMGVLCCKGCYNEADEDLAELPPATATA